MSSIHEEGSQSGEQVLPFYIVCDESASMSSNGGIDAINSALPELHEKIASNPLVNDKARIALIAFSDDAEVLLPLSAAADVEDMPGVMPKGATSYGSAFRLLKTQIATDIATFNADGFKVLRPAVFFISDGGPTDSDWQTHHVDLVDDLGRQVTGQVDAMQHRAHRRTQQVGVEVVPGAIQQALALVSDVAHGAELHPLVRRPLPLSLKILRGVVGGQHLHLGGGRGWRRHEWTY